MPFAQAAKHLKRSTRVDLSEPTVRRHTQAAGAAYVAVQTHVAETILTQSPPVPACPSRVVVSVDGAMVPLRQGAWAEVKTLVIGVVDHNAEGALHDLSYFSRLQDAATFTDLAVVETHGRGVVAAQQVAAVVDGAEWIQGFLDVHCPDAVRILDFPHAAEHLNQVGQGVLGTGTPEAQAWLRTQCHTLKHTGPGDVLAVIHSLLGTKPATDSVREHTAYLERRVGQMNYPQYAADGWPLGSGVVESANKVVVEARLKGAGMRWARAHVDPMLALRNIVYSDRWEDGWQQVATELRRQEQAARVQRRQARTLRHAIPPCETRGPLPSAVVVVAAVPSSPPACSAPPTVVLHEPGRPAANHPWRRGWSRRRQADQARTA
ncbi:MAG: hypothetical protein NVS4B2_34070 [Chloroflexota bacterium]